MTPRIPPPTYEYLNAELLEQGSGRVRCRFRPTEEMTNPLGAVQGGILAAFFDDTMGPAIYSISEGRGFTTAGKPSKPSSPCSQSPGRNGNLQFLQLSDT